MKTAELPDAVQRTVSFFFAPMLQTIALVALLWYLAAFPIPELIAGAAGAVVGSPGTPVFEFLKQSELLKLAPVVASFAFLVWLVLLRSATRSVAQLLPPHVELHSDVLIARLGAVAHTLALWNTVPGAEVSDILETVELNSRERLREPINKQARMDAHYWRERAAMLMRGFDTFKVFSYVAFVCAALGLRRHLPFHQLILRLAVIELILVSCAVTALVHSLFATYQEFSQVTSPWQIADRVWSGNADVPTNETHASELSKIALARWWKFRVVKPGFFESYWDILRGGGAETKGD